MPDVNEAAVAIAKEETRQTEALADAQVKTAEIQAASQEKQAEAIAGAVQAEVKEEAKILGMWTEAELLEIMDECGRHIMELEASGGEATSQSEETEKKSTTTAVESVPVTSSEAKPDSPSGNEAASTVQPVVEVEVPQTVSAAEVKQESRPSMIRTLIFGRVK